MQDEQDWGPAAGEQGLAGHRLPGSGSTHTSPRVTEITQGDSAGRKQVKDRGLADHLPQRVLRRRKAEDGKHLGECRGLERELQKASD